MKKTIKMGMILIIIGFGIGEFIFGNKKELWNKILKKETYYFIQEGVYTDKESLQNNLKKLNQKIVDYQENQYYVYVGITKKKEVAQRIQDIYEKIGYNVYLKEKRIASEEFSMNVSQFDILLEDAEEEEEILTIEKVVLANYEEIIKKS